MLQLELGAAATSAHIQFMIAKTLTLLARAMDNACSQKVAVADLARQSSPPDKILLTSLSQESRNRNERLNSGGGQPPQRVTLLVLAGCYFRDYRQALAALDAVWAFASDTPVLSLDHGEEPLRLHLVSPAASEVAAYWSALRMPIVPSLFLQVDTVRLPSIASRDELPVLQRPPVT